jgi:N-acetylmuramoyl-L-alanine amidase
MMAALLACALLGAPAMAEHGPWQEGLTCPAGTAEVVLDPGHGGGDPGAVNEAFGLHEDDLVLAIAARVAELLQAEGITVALTREDDVVELGNSARGDIANLCAARVFVSIHLNGSTDPDANFAQAFWGEKPKDLALTQVMTGALGALGIPVHAPESFDNGGLMRAKMPAVLVEAVFLTHDPEAEALAGQERPEAIAEAIAAGVMEWLALGEAA